MKMSQFVNAVDNYFELAQIFCDRDDMSFDAFCDWHDNNDGNTTGNIMKDYPYFKEEVNS